MITESIITGLLVSVFYVMLCLWVGCSAFNRTKKASSVPAWAGFSMAVTPIIGCIAMFCACENQTHVETKGPQHPMNRAKIEPAI